MQLKFTVSVHIEAIFIVGKPKILLETNISAKTASLEIIDNISPNSQKKSQNSCKNRQKNILCAQNGSKLPPWVKGSSQILT